MSTRFWYRANGDMIRATSGRVDSVPGADGFTTIPPTNGRAKWNGSAWDPPPPPSNAERLNTLFKADTDAVIMSAFADLLDRVQALEGTAPGLRQNVREWLESHLP